MSVQKFRIRKSRHTADQLPCYASDQREVEGSSIRGKSRSMPDSFYISVSMDANAQPLMQKLKKQTESPLSQYVNMRESLESTRGMSAATYW